MSAAIRVEKPSRRVPCANAQQYANRKQSISVEKSPSAKQSRAIETASPSMTTTIFLTRHD
ncbi:hypothetical protein SAMN05216360_107292 [Methylobacterium phyllostachyos]|uniref:Uncharacterized protein n=1 Tax=Methylobacterium phyllostachyos TaxID=582672 RepID=A0A1H0AQJ1_9HYPH|nr:hypothetical protein SAMN05216360_107292 [Methylobacterium phyllostachyos]